jgi:hypothetical protein
MYAAVMVFTSQRVCVGSDRAPQVWGSGLALLGAHTLLALVFLYWYRGAASAAKGNL